MNSSLPVIAALTPDRPPAVPDGATVFDSPIRNGLPHRLDLLPRWQVVLSVPTGSAAAWLDASPGAPIPDGAARLRFQIDGVTRHVIPLVRGEGFKVVDGGQLRLAGTVLDWVLHVGDMVGAGDFGSFIRLALSVADKAAAQFGPIPPSDFVITALSPEDRTESRPGNRIPLRYHRLRLDRMRRQRELLR
ncbi:MAG: hypothetical protein WCY11_13070 [Novosphingobium sp.]